MAEMDDLKPKRPRAAAPATKKATKPAAARKSGFSTESPPDLRGELRAFASARPAGWDHQDWMSFLDHLTERGHDTSNAEDIGRQLERERLAVVLGQVRGLGPKRSDALVGRFETLWSIRQADVDDLARVPGMNRPLAEQVRQALQR
jgi:hypothetical protein